MGGLVAAMFHRPTRPQLTARSPDQDRTINKFDAWGVTLCVLAVLWAIPTWVYRLALPGTLAPLASVLCGCSYDGRTIKWRH
jgi:hypothetical protein